MISQLEEKDNVLSFFATNVDVSLLVALRQILMSEIPTMGVSRVEVITNTSLTNDVFLSHRLEMVPVVTEMEKVLTLEVEGKDFFTEGDLMEGFLIAKVLPSQEVKVKLHLSPGLGKDHIKYSPVCNCFFQPREKGYFFTFESLVRPPQELLRAAFALLGERVQNFQTEDGMVGKLISSLARHLPQTEFSAYSSQGLVLQGIDVPTIREHASRYLSTFVF